MLPTSPSKPGPSTSHTPSPLTQQLSPTRTLPSSPSTPSLQLHQTPSNPIGEDRTPTGTPQPRFEVANGPGAGAGEAGVGSGEFPLFERSNSGNGHSTSTGEPGPSSLANRRASSSSSLNRSRTMPSRRNNERKGSDHTIEGLDEEEEGDDERAKVNGKSGDFGMGPKVGAESPRSKGRGDLPPPPGMLAFNGGRRTSSGNKQQTLPNLNTKELPSLPSLRRDHTSGEPLPLSAPGLSSSSSSRRIPRPIPISTNSSTPATSSSTSTSTSTPKPPPHPTPSTPSTRPSDQLPRSTHPNPLNSDNNPPTTQAKHHLQNYKNTFLPEDVARKMKRWVQEVVVCNFDIDRGPVVERRMIGRPWGKGERANVAFSAFPDTSLFAEGSISYSFKIRESMLPQRNGDGERVGDRSRQGSGDGSGGSGNGSDSYFSENDTADGTPADDAQGASKEQDKVAEALSSLGISGNPNSQDPSTPSIPLPKTPTPSTPQPKPKPSDPFFGPGTEIPETPFNQKVFPTAGETAEDYRKWDERGREWLFGFVWFCQKKDRAITRGYMQRSIVILTHLPLPSLFLAVLDKAAPMYFDHGYPALEAMCYGFASWPDPIPGAEIQLPLLTEILTVRLPELSEEAQLPPPPAQRRLPGLSPIILASLPPISPLKAFSSCLPSLWHLWECMILGEPLLVIAPDPQTCSTIVWWLRDIMRPIPMDSADLRPYLHIHDLDFRLLVNSSKPQPGVVVGVTNPFFRNAAGHWPNVVSIGAPSPSRTKTSTLPNNTVDHPEGFMSARKRHVSKDRALLARLEKLVAAKQYDDHAGNEALRTHFIQLTEKMLSPLNRYVASLIPPVGSPEGIKPFTLNAFLTHLKAMAPNPLQFRSKGLTTKGKVELEFFTSFCKSPGFPSWLRIRMVDLTEAKWGAGQAARIPHPVLHLASNGSHGQQSPRASPSLFWESASSRNSEESSRRSSMGSSAWNEGRRGSDAAVWPTKSQRRLPDR